jgi:Subtilisin-like serine proteases
MKKIIFVSMLAFFIMLTPLVVSAKTFDDQRYKSGELWGHTRINVENAWDISSNCSNVKVAVIDQAKSNHEDLLGENIWWMPIWDTGDHGTHVSGTIGARADNTIGIVGIAPNVEIVSLDVSAFDLNKKAIDGGKVEKAIKYATDAGIPIINLSYGGYSFDNKIYNAIKNYPGLVVCSTGNADNDNDDKKHYPSCYDLPNIIAVGRSSVDTNNNDVRQPGSPRGKNNIDLFAPGTKILSASGNSDYLTKSGTSMAAPHVTGVAALIKSIRPDMSAAQIKKHIMDNVDYISDLSDKCVSGGRLNAYWAVNTLKNVAPQARAENVSGGWESINVKGWAWDPNHNSLSTNLHVYIGGPAGVGEFHNITANKSRDDVNSVFRIKGEHGFDDWISTSKRGRQSVYIYAIDTGGGYNPLIWSGTVDIQSHVFAGGLDTVAPKITGWASDRLYPDTSISAHVYIYRSNNYRTGDFGRAVRAMALPANEDRGDLVPHGLGLKHGYSWDPDWVSLGGGSYVIDVYAVGFGTNARIASKTYTYNPADNFRGQLDMVSPYIRGWTWDTTQPNTPIDAHVYVYGQNGQGDFSVPLRADNTNRTNELRNAGIGNGVHAYDWDPNWNLRKPGRYRIVVYAVARGTSRVIGDVYYDNKLADGEYIWYKNYTYILAGGAPLLIQNYDKFKPYTNRAVTDEEWNSLAAAPRNGTIVYGASTGRWYQFASGRPYYIQSDSMVSHYPTVRVDDWVFEHPKHSLTRFTKTSLSDRDDGVVSGGVYTIKKRGTNRALDIPYGHKSNGIGVQLYQNNDAENQMFRFDKQTDGTYKIISMHSKKALNIKGGSMKENADIIQWTSNSDLNERFYVVKIDDHYRIISAYNGMCVDVHGNSTTNGARIDQYFDNGSDAQKFSLVRRQYTVTLYANGVSTINFSDKVSITQNWGSSVTLPHQTQMMLGSHDLLGYSESQTATTATYFAGASYTFNTDKTLYAVWKPKTYMVTYDADGGSPTPAPQQKTYGVPIKLSTIIPTKKGYRFVGWSIPERYGWNGSKTVFQPGNEFNESSLSLLTAKWQIKSVNFTGNPPNGKGAVTGVPTGSVQWNTTAGGFVMPDAVPALEGHVFLGWAISWNDKRLYQPGDKVQDDTSATMYAQWSRSEYKYTFDKTTPGISPDLPDVLTKPYNSSVTIPSIYPAIEGYSFSYYIGHAEDGNTYRLMPGQVVNVNQNMTIKASIVMKSYLVKYDANGGTGAPTPHSKQHFTNLVLRTDVPTRTGYTFLGWATSAGAAAAEYQPGDGYTTNAVNTLYAVWQINRYTLTFDLDGGYAIPEYASLDPITEDYNTSITLPIDYPVKEDFECIGWSTTQGSRTSEYVAGDSYTIDADATLYPVWWDYTYIVTYNANAGAGADNVTGIPQPVVWKYIESYTISRFVPVREGYGFVGWSKISAAATADYQPEDLITLTGDLDLYAVWNPNTYTIAFNLNDGTGSFPNMTKTYGQELTLPSAIPTKTDYHFAGWSTANDDETEFAAGEAFDINANTTLYAVWVEKCFGTIVLADGTIINMKNEAEFNVLCRWHDYSPTSTFTVKGITFARNKVLEFSFGDDFNLTSIGNYFLSYCENLNSAIVVPETVESIGNGFISHCSSFNSEVKLPSNLKSIGDTFLRVCSNFDNPITLPNTVEIIGSNFMSQCERFNSAIVLSNNLEVIHSEFMNACHKFNQPLTLPSSIEAIGEMFMYHNQDMVSTITVNCPASVFCMVSPGHEGMNSEGIYPSFYTAHATNPSYVQGIPIAGPYAAQVLAKFPNTANRNLRLA